MNTTEGDTLLLDDSPRHTSGFFAPLFRLLFPPFPTPDHPRTPTKRELFLIIISCLLLSVAAVTCYSWQELNGGTKGVNIWAQINARQWVGLFLSHSIITAAIIFACLPQGRGAIALLPDDRIVRSGFYPAIVIICWLIANLFEGHFNPLSFVCVVLLSFLYVYSAHSFSSSDTFNSSDMCLLLALGAIIDLRWYETWWQGLGSFGYDWWALALSLMIIAAYNSLSRSLRYVSISFVPKWRDLIGILLSVISICIIVIPAGLLSGFLKVNVHNNALSIVTYFFENFYTIALIEELIFRVILVQALSFGIFASFEWSQFWSMLVSSALFGLWHWPREHQLDTQLLYVLFAFICGFFYAFTYRSSTNILAPMILHALVDTVWGAVLHTN